MSKWLNSLPAVILLLFSSSRAATLHVPQDYDFIQTAIDSAAMGDTILVNTGTYQENLDFHAKHLSLISVAGRDSTSIVSAQDGLNIIRIGDAVHGQTLVRGFTVSGARNASGIISYQSYTTITDCEVRDCLNAAGGGGIYAENGRSITISDCKIHDNSSYGNGGGIFVSFNSSAIVTRNEIYENTAPDGSAIYTRDSPGMVISYNTIYRNISHSPGFAQEAVSLTYGEEKCFKNTIVLNTAGLFTYQYSVDLIHSNIIAFNELTGYAASAVR